MARYRLLLVSGSALPYRRGSVRGISRATKSATPAQNAAVMAPARGCEGTPPNAGNPMLLQKACAATGAAKWPVRRNRKAAYQPKTVVKANWNATCSQCKRGDQVHADNTREAEQPNLWLAHDSAALRTDVCLPSAAPGRAGSSGGPRTHGGGAGAPCQRIAGSPGLSISLSSPAGEACNIVGQCFPMIGTCQIGAVKIELGAMHNL